MKHTRRPKTPTVPSVPANLQTFRIRHALRDALNLMASDVESSYLRLSGIASSHLLCNHRRYLAKGKLTAHIGAT